MRRALLLFLLAVLVTAAAPSAAVEPEPPLPLDSLFTPPAEEPVPPAVAAPRSPTGGIVATIQDQQRRLYAGLAGALRAVKVEHSAAAVFALLALSFLYGIFHAAGPGHGKAVISAYLLANERAVRRGIGLSFAASLAQAVTAILVVTAILFALQGAGVTTGESLDTMAVVSAGMIVALGAWMLAASLRNLVRGAPSAADAAPHHDCGHDHHVAPPGAPDRLSWLGAGSIVAAIGIRPCSGAIFVLLFANTIGLYAVGVVSTLAMALGTAITVSALAILTLWSKRTALRLAGVRAGWLAWTYRAFGVLGALAVLGLGIVLLLATSAPESPFPA